jgi:hypothetical protein
LRRDSKTTALGERYKPGRVSERVSFKVGILLANLFPRYNAELYTKLFPGLGAFKAVKCEAKF